MNYYQYDPTTGKRLIRSGIKVNAAQPMTQKEVDRQCDLVSAFLDAGCDEIREENEPHVIRSEN